MSEPSPPLPNEKLVRVFETELDYEAMIVKGLLKSEGIDALVGEAENIDVLPVGGISILVREGDVERAREVLSNFRRTPEQEAVEEEAFDETAMEATETEEPEH